MKTQYFKKLISIEKNRVLKQFGLNKDQANYVKMLVSNFGKSLEDAVFEAKNNYLSLNLIVVKE